MKYEYKKRVDDSVTNEQLNILGAEGWKLVSVTLSPRGNSFHEYYFIRKIKEKKEYLGPH